MQSISKPFQAFTSFAEHCNHNSLFQPNITPWLEQSDQTQRDRMIRSSQTEKSDHFRWREFFLQGITYTKEQMSINGSVFYFNLTSKYERCCYIFTKRNIKACRKKMNNEKARFRTWKWIVFMYSFHMDYTIHFGKKGLIMTTILNIELIHCKLIN